MHEDIRVAFLSFFGAIAIGIVAGFVAAGLLAFFSVPLFWIGFIQGSTQLVVIFTLLNK